MDDLLSALNRSVKEVGALENAVVLKGGVAMILTPASWLSSPQLQLLSYEHPGHPVSEATTTTLHLCAAIDSIFRDG